MHRFLSLDQVFFSILSFQMHPGLILTFWRGSRFHCVTKFNLISQTMRSENYKCSSACTFLHPHVTSYVLHPNTLISTLSTSIHPSEWKMKFHMSHTCRHHNVSHWLGPHRWSTGVLSHWADGLVGREVTLMNFLIVHWLLNCWEHCCGQYQMSWNISKQQISAASLLVRFFGYLMPANNKSVLQVYFLVYLVI
jgi:hypothetical protein